MNRLSLFTLIFAILSFVFIILLIVLRFKLPLYPLMSYQDTVDLLTPLALVPISWLIFKSSAKNATPLAEELAFIVAAAVWVEGHGMHLSANSIHNLIDAFAKSSSSSLVGSDIFKLVYFFDEDLGHWVWHIGMIGLAAVLIHHEWRNPIGARTDWRLAIPGGVLYGFTLFAIFVEGQTVILGLPFALLVVLFGWFAQRANLSQRPVLAFFTVACTIAMVLFAGWGIYFRGFPQFSDVGLI